MNDEEAREQKTRDRVNARNRERFRTDEAYRKRSMERNKAWYAKIRADIKQKRKELLEG